MSRRQVYDLVNNATIGFDDRLGKDIPAHSLGSNIYLGPLALMQSDAILSTIIVHELAHLPDCNNSWERPYSVVDFNPHGCCDVIAYKLGFRTFIIETSRAQDLLDGLKALGVSPQAQLTTTAIINTVYKPGEKKMIRHLQENKYKVWLWPIYDDDDYEPDPAGWNILSVQCHRRWKPPYKPQPPSYYDA